jgi:hypothetical protein
MPSAAKQFAEKVVDSAKSLPQALKRGHNLNDLTARVELVPFPFVEKFEFFSKL